MKNSINSDINTTETNEELMELSPMELEKSKAEATRDAKLFHALNELDKNPHWNYLIKEYYLKEQVLDKNSLLAVDYQRADRPKIMEELVSISHFGETMRLLALKYVQTFGSDMNPEEAVRQAEAL